MRDFTLTHSLCVIVSSDDLQAVDATLTQSVYHCECSLAASAPTILALFVHRIELDDRLGDRAYPLSSTLESWVTSLEKNLQFAVR